jgi:hypothetical protein
LGATSLNENEQGHKRALFGNAAQKVERARIDKHSSRATPPAQSSHAPQGTMPESVAKAVAEGIALGREKGIGLAAEAIERLKYADLD